MIVTDVGVVERKGGVALQAIVRPDAQPVDGFRLEYFIRSGDPSWLAADGDAFVAPLLMLAMAQRERLVVEAPVSSALLKRLPTISDIYRAWFPGLTPVEVQAPASAPTARPDGGGGLFFSGGVDSFYSLLKARASHERPVTHLMLVLGFDVRQRNPVLFDKIARRVADVALQADRHLLVVETNIRQLSDPIVGWHFYHGAAMAGVALALGGVLERALIASWCAYQELRPWGSHPLLDPLWSTERVRVLHDGCEATRLQKVRHIAASDLALGALRVCWANEGTDYNCGRCEKCLRTMLALHVSGALHRCHVFAQPFSPSAVARIPIEHAQSALFLDELRQALGDTPYDRRLARAIRQAVCTARGRQWLGAFLREHIGPWATLPHIRRAWNARRPVRSHGVAA
jgi:hypothetical protein